MAFTHLSLNRTRESAGRLSRIAGRLMGVAGAFVLVASFVAVGAPASAAPGDAHLAGLEYVALGDSYAAGFGLTPASSFPLAGCAQSSQNYPHQVASELGLALTDVTCSGARTENLTTTPQVVFDGTAAVQDSSLSSTTDVVTLTIGGNDVGYVDIMTFCAALSATGNVFGDPAAPFSLPDCKAHYAPPAPGVDSLEAAILGPVTVSLNAVLDDIALKAPNAKIFVLGYPALTPAVVPPGVNGCFTTALGSPLPVNSYPYTLVDVPYLHGIESLFDQTLASVATAPSHGATMISLFGASSTHSPCGPPADAYVNGVSVTAFSFAPASVTLAPGGLHPNAAGAAFQATQVEAAIRAAFPAPVAPATPAAASARAVLAATGSAGGGWLAVTGVLLLLMGGVVLGVGRATARRSL